MGVEKHVFSSCEKKEKKEGKGYTRGGPPGEYLWEGKGKDRPF